MCVSYNALMHGKALVLCSTKISVAVRYNTKVAFVTYILSESGTVGIIHHHPAEESSHQKSVMN